VNTTGSPLAAIIAGLIREEGPLGIDRYMALCLGHPEHGYYRAREPFGRTGDFTTAPEISQMFGELAGLALADRWIATGRPPAADLVEIGPGRGTLMADLLRATRAVPGLADTLSVTLVETSPRLAGMQRERLAGLHPRLGWTETLEAVPGGRPLFLVGNEFLDALPVRQFQRQDGRWHERRVGLDAAGRLAFGLTPTDAPGLPTLAPEGAVREVCEPALLWGRTLGQRLARDGGMALLIDYGHAESGFGDTLQAVRGHTFADPLERPGEADLTAHVDFAAFAAACRSGGAATFGPETQGDWLRALGIEARAAALAARATPAQARAVHAALQRLTDSQPTGMGALFKVLAVSPPGAPPPAGFRAG
jgi:SAM-dependent MidA family methyltransferase